MVRTLTEFDPPVVDSSGQQYVARACGHAREDGLWEGWIEFENTHSGEVLRSGRETTQPNLRDVTYWATGLTPVYLEGALARTLDEREPSEPVSVPPPCYDGPAEPGWTRPRYGSRT